MTIIAITTVIIIIITITITIIIIGSLIIMSQRQGPREHVYLCLFIISLLAWGIDRLILMAQKQLFPHLKHG